MYREIELMKIGPQFLLFVYSGLVYSTIINPYSNHYDLVIHILWIPLQIIFMMVVWSLIRCIVSDPGKVPIYWGYFLDDSERDKKKIYCLTCHIFKPDRCHHCKTCGRCVLNMDHHCPWIGNCIGHQNRKFFILFLLYINLAVFFSVIILFLRIYPLLIDIIYHNFTKIRIFQVILTMFLTIVLCVFEYFIREFLIYHINLISKNKTTLEILSIQRNESEQIITNYFDLGIKKNWLSVMETNPWLWPFPMFGESGRPQGDGVKWERNQAQITITQTNRTLTNQNQRNQVSSSQRI